MTSVMLTIIMHMEVSYRQEERTKMEQERTPPPNSNTVAFKSNWNPPYVVT